MKVPDFVGFWAWVVGFSQKEPDNVKSFFFFPFVFFKYYFLKIKIFIKFFFPLFFHHFTKKFWNKILYLKIRFLLELFVFWMKFSPSSSWKSWFFLSLWVHLIFLWKLIKIIDFQFGFCLTDIPSELTRNTPYSISFDSERRVLSPWSENQGHIPLPYHSR